MQQLLLHFNLLAKLVYEKVLGRFHVDRRVDVGRLLAAAAIIVLRVVLFVLAHPIVFANVNITAAAASLFTGIRIGIRIVVIRFAIIFATVANSIRCRDQGKRSSPALNGYLRIFDQAVARRRGPVTPQACRPDRTAVRRTAEALFDDGLGCFQLSLHGGVLLHQVA